LGYHVFLTFDLTAYRFHFRAVEPVFFPAGKAGNILRGAFGLLFRQAAEAAGRPGLYDRIFQPSAEDQLPAHAPRPSGLQDLPRPFVFRASHLDGRTLARAEEFHFDFHLFDSHLAVADSVSSILTAAFARLAETGVGPLRTRAELTAVDERPVQIAFDGTAAPTLDRPRHLRLRFVTPTELKSEGQPVEFPEFAVLISRVRDRVSTLRALYGPGPLPIDFSAIAHRAEAVRITRCEIDRVHVERRSSRTGQRHSIGGFLGEVDYEGNITEFLPYLEAARWTGVGRHTVWGNGAVAFQVG
jgi:hypothetical protein